MVLFAVVRETEGKGPSGRLRRIWDDNIKMDLKKGHGVEVQRGGAGEGFCGTGYTEGRGRVVTAEIAQHRRKEGQQLLTHSPKI